MTRTGFLSQEIRSHVGAARLGFYDFECCPSIDHPIEVRWYYSLFGPLNCFLQHNILGQKRSEIFF